MNRQHGFSLVELMVVIVIMGILMGIAGPSFLDFIRRSQAMGAVNEFVSDINMARSEALRKRSRVVICSRQSDTNCGAATDWNSGYLIFVDADSDGVFDAGEQLVKSVQSPGSRLSLAVTATATTSAVSSLAFRPSGGVPV
ncbi:MAG: type fimbrial biosis protein FimT, partial [Pseudomonadota bacterium]|nr:type fimbrial biosis protein FimT [Pseudomonadota bacterium]